MCVCAMLAASRHICNQKMSPAWKAECKHLSADYFLSFVPAIKTTVTSPCGLQTSNRPALFHTWSSNELCPI